MQRDQFLQTVYCLISTYSPENDLLNKGVLISKKSCGKTKYALNKDRRIEISSIVEKGHFHDDRLYNVLTRDKKTVPSRFLSDLEIPQELETTSE